MLSDYQILVDSLVRDQSGTLMPADRDRAIELARLRYSADVRRTLVEDITWTPAGYLGPLPASWTDGAWIMGAEYPIGQQPPAELELTFYLEPSTQALMADVSLDAGSVVRVTYAAPHLLTGSADTIALEHREAVASYAAHVLCKQLAAHYSGDRETSIGADGSNTESRARNYALRAKDYRASYYSGVGKADPQSAGGASGAVGGGDAAASVGAWEGRSRARFPTNDLGGL